MTEKITKTISLDQNVVKELEKLAEQERRSFTKQIEVMLESALNQKGYARPEKK